MGDYAKINPKGWKEEPMPLEFESISHGKIAFGFFNIETDMILLNQYFLFAEDICHYIIQATENNNDPYKHPGRGIGLKIRISEI